MATAHITHHLDPAAVKALLTSPQGGVIKDLIRRGTNVQNAAKKHLETYPRRVNTGLLRSSIKVQIITVGGNPAVSVGTNIRYAVWVHDGTGIYGPAGHLIKPKTKQVMRWLSKKHGGYAFAKTSKGMRPNRFLKESLKFAKG